MQQTNSIAFSGESETFHTLFLSRMTVTLLKTKRVFFSHLASRKHTLIITTGVTWLLKHAIQQERVIFFFTIIWHSKLLDSVFSFVTWYFSLYLSLLSTRFIILSPIPFLLSEVYKISMCYLISWLHLPCFIQRHRLLWTHIHWVRTVGRYNESSQNKQDRYNKKSFQLTFLCFIARRSWELVLHRNLYCIRFLFPLFSRLLTATLLKLGLLLCLVTGK